MNELLRRISEQQAAGFILVLGRVAPVFILAPLFSSRLMPRRARGIAAVGLAVGMTPIVSRGQRIPLDPAGLGQLMLKEIVIGLAFAYAVAAVLAAANIAGSFLDTLVGFSYGSVVDPVTGVQSPVLSQIYGFVAVMVFIAIGGDALMIHGLARTYELVPLDQFPALAPMTVGVQEAFARVFTAALELAAPVFLALIITDAALGFLSRVVPQLNVFAVGFPAKIGVGVLLIGASLPFTGGYIADELDRSVAEGLGSLRSAR